MPIYRGDRKIASIYRGDRKIVKIFRGDRQVYSAKKRVLLFVQGTTPIYKAKYVFSNNLNAYTQFLAPANFDATQRIYEFSYKGTLPLTLYRQDINTTTIRRSYIRLGGVQNPISFPADNNINKVVINKDKLYINDAFVKKLVIGETLDTQTSQRLYFYGDYSFYEMKIYQGDLLIYHFVPAYQILPNGDLVYGIAELTGKEFVNNGNMIGEPEYEE